MLSICYLAQIRVIITLISLALVVGVAVALVAAVAAVIVATAMLITAIGFIYDLIRDCNEMDK